MGIEYEKARRIGEKAYRKAVLDGKYPYLPALEDFLGDEKSHAILSAGIMEIPLRMVTGTRTRGRQEAFADNFMPLLEEKSEFAVKWEKLYEAQMDEGIREPVKAYEYMCKFYILEGNKRVSVLKYVGSPYILADVTRIMPVGKDDKDFRLYYEFDEFFRATKLYDIQFTEEGSYRRLAEIFDVEPGEQWPDEKLLELKQVYEILSGVYAQRGGKEHPDTVGDIFLLYVTLFGVRGLAEESEAEIGRNLDRIQAELRISENKRSVELQEEPQEAEAGNTLFTIWKKQVLYTEKNPLHVAFLYDGAPERSSWIYGHELGRNHVDAVCNGRVVTKAWTDTNTEDRFQDAVAEAAADDARLIITTSPVQMENALRAAVTYPDIRFLNCSVNLSHSLVRTYYGRMHEAKFLMGVLAGSLSRDHKIGYVADYPIYGAMARINAFAVGAALVDPGAKIYLTWTSLQNSDWLEYMKTQGITTISGPDLIKPLQTSRDYGLYQIKEDGSIMNLAMPIWNWGKYYVNLIQSVVKGNFDRETAGKKDQALNYWWGMSAGVIDVILSGHLSYYSRKMVDLIRNGIIHETLHPFTGELRDQSGAIRLAEGELLSKDGIVRMDWLNDNVVGHIPSMEELTEAGKQAVRISGAEIVRMNPEGGI